MAFRPFFMLGRIAILKMNVLPRLLYLFQAIPIKLSPSFFTAYKRMCRNFIWASKTPKLLGGLGLPDIQKYHWTCHLTRIMDWHVHQSIKDWIKLENSFAHTLLSHLPWINHKSIPKEYSARPLIGATLLHFKYACKNLAITPSPGPMTPLNHNPDFSPGLSLHDSTNDPHSSITGAQQLFHNGNLLSYQAISSKFPELNIPFYKYLQLRHFLGEAKLPLAPGLHTLKIIMQQWRTPTTPDINCICAPILNT